MIGEGNLLLGALFQQIAHFVCGTEDFTAMLAQLHALSGLASGRSEIACRVLGRLQKHISQFKPYS